MTSAPLNVNPSSNYIHSESTSSTGVSSQFVKSGAGKSIGTLSSIDKVMTRHQRASLRPVIAERIVSTIAERHSKLTDVELGSICDSLSSNQTDSRLKKYVYTRAEKQNSRYNRFIDTSDPTRSRDGDRPVQMSAKEACLPYRLVVARGIVDSNELHLYEEHQSLTDSDLGEIEEQGLKLSGGKKELGRGGYGSVNLVRKIGKNITDRWCAMKTAKDDAHYLDQEINNCRLLQVNSAEKDIKGHFIASDAYIPMFWTEEGEQAAVLISKAATPMKEDEYSKDYQNSTNDQRKRKLISLAESVQSVQEMGLSHRDLKPKNVVKVANGDWVLIDFGLSEVTETMKENGGTELYAAPEVLNRDFCALNAPTDVYSLGLLFAEAIGENRIIYLDDNRSVGLFKQKQRGSKPEQRMLFIKDLFSERRRFIRQAETDGGEHSGSPLRKLIAQMISVDPKKRGDLGDVIKALTEMDLEAFSVEK